MKFVQLTRPDGNPVFIRSEAIIAVDCGGSGGAHVYLSNGMERFLMETPAQVKKILEDG